MYIIVGKFLQTHGIQGYLKAIPYSGLPDRFEYLRTLYTADDGEMRGWIIEDIRITDRESLIKLRGISTREEAKLLVKKEIWLPESEKIELPEGSYFIHDLLDLKVFEIDGNYLGVLKDVLSSNGSDIYVVRKDDGGEILIPAVSEFVQEIDFEKKTIQVRLIKGMADDAD